MVATSDFSGFDSSDCALASAAASAAIDSLDRCMGVLRLEDIEADGSVLRAARPDPVADTLLGVLREEGLEFRLGPFVFAIGLASPQEDAGELGPAVRGAHVDHPDGFDARSRRLDPEQAGRFPGFDAAPELFLGREKEVLIERVGRDGDLDPLAPTGDNRKHRHLDVGDPHIVLELWHVFFRRRLLGKRPRQHEFGFEHRPGLYNDAVYGRSHPPNHRVADSALDILEGLARIALEPVPIEGLSHDHELDDQVARKVQRFKFASLFAPEAQQRRVVLPKDDPGIGPANERASIWGHSYTFRLKNDTLSSVSYW